MIKNCNLYVQLDADENYPDSTFVEDAAILTPSCAITNPGVSSRKGEILAIEKAGYKTIELDVSEYGKLDGWLSCLSLRF